MAGGKCEPPVGTLISRQFAIGRGEVGNSELESGDWHPGIGSWDLAIGSSELSVGN